MSNIYKKINFSSVLAARLKVLLDSINETYTSGAMALESDLVSLYHNSLELFFESLNQSISKSLFNIKAGLPSDPRGVNLFTGSVQQDLQCVFAEIGALDKLIAASFNAVLVEKEQVLQIIKRIASKIGDYLLYADPSLGAGFFFGDSFNTSDRLDLGSSLVEGEECYHSPEEGAIFLPLDGAPVRPKIDSVTINKSSNGTTGNNHQLDVTGHGEIEVITDGKPNTWFEYENVVFNEINTPLVLNLTIKLKEIAVINHIHINAMFFGTPTAVKVSSINTSVDGKEYLSVKDEIPVADFLLEDEENVFSLSPASSKFAGQGFYSFLARKAQYVNIVLEQNSPYPIETLNGSRLRYAIGLRDINILSRKFLESGSIVSHSFDVESEVKKISLLASENPLEPSVLASINHFVSHNDGAEWWGIQPQNIDAYGTPEIVDYNTYEQKAIITETSVSSFRHKISMSRDKAAFEGGQIITTETIPKIEVSDLPSGGEFEVFLKEKPVEESVRVLLPYVGSFSCPRDRAGESVAEESAPMDLDFVEFSVDASSDTSLRYKLPFEGIPNLEKHIRVFVNRAQIEYCPKTTDAFSSPTPTSYGSIDSESRIYFLNKKGKEIQFGYTDSTGTQRGFIPPAGSKISVCLDGDNPLLELTDKGYQIHFSAPSDGNTETTSLVALKTLEEEGASSYEIEIPSGSRTWIAPIATQSIGEYLSSDTTKEDLGKYTSSNASNTKEGTSDSVEVDTGAFLPLFLSGISNFELKEYDLSGNLITGNNRQFTDKKEYVDGYLELYGWFGDDYQDRYTFDAETGTVYLSIPAPEDRKVVLVCKKIDAFKIPASLWSFDKGIVSNRINTQEVLLDPSVVYTVPLEFYYSTTTDNQKSISLFTNNEEQHNWFNKRLVKGTIKPDQRFFVSGAKPLEVTFVDGKTEFQTVKESNLEPLTFSSVSANLWSATLSQISSTQTLASSVTFAPVRSTNSALTPTNQFSLNGEKESFSELSSSGSNGDWAVENGVVRLFLSSTPADHTASYKYQVIDPGIDIESLYSVDYLNGVIYFATPIQSNGVVKYEVSAYSAFYNISEVIKDADISEINSEEKTIKFKTAFGMRFLKQDLAAKTRPQILKILYNYNKESVESLADLEPYFSPVCKDVAFRAVTSDLLELL
jgi:hypothetical protein